LEAARPSRAIARMIDLIMIFSKKDIINEAAVEVYIAKILD
jgi:hypothetical protein